MESILDWFKKQWGYLLMLVAVVTAITVFIDMRETDAAVEKKMEKHDETFEQVKQIAEDLQDPSVQLRIWLVNQGIDTAQARIWSQMQKGPIPDSLGNPLPNIPFLKKKRLMDVGILQMYDTEGHLKTLDTLWNFLKE